MTAFIVKYYKYYKYFKAQYDISILIIYKLINYNTIILYFVRMYKPCVLDEYITNHYTRHCMSETSNYKLVVFDSETLRNDTFLVKLIIVQENYIPIE